MKCPHGKQNDEGMAGSAAENTVRGYSSQMVGLGDSTSDILNRDNAGPSTAVNVHTVFQQVNQG